MITWAFRENRQSAGLCAAKPLQSKLLEVLSENSHSNGSNRSKSSLTEPLAFFTLQFLAISLKVEEVVWRALARLPGAISWSFKSSVRPRDFAK